ncbi:MAG: hypothetical protein DSY70_06560 [Desulfobulbus sp.]|nr:MAG: hypothetical protein DSY70_06560 [Desulfobulbus sp.]
MKRKWFRITAGLSMQIFLLSSLCFAGGLDVSCYTSANGNRSLFHWCTGIFFIRNREWVVSLKDNQLFSREKGGKSFLSAGLDLKRPHSLAYNQQDSLYYLVDTDNHRLLYGTSLLEPSSLSFVTSLAGCPLKRPHDVIVDDQTGWVYVLNPNPVQVFRFKQIDVVEVLDLSSTLVYSRALSLINGKVYVVGSSSGQIVEIEDFAQKKYRVYKSHGKKKIISSGDWQESGLVNNDLEFYKGFWYLTSYFYAESCETEPCDYDKNKFIRFSSWADFEKGRWEDLSSYLPSGLVPYFLTRHDGALFVAMYNHSFPGRGDAIYKIVDEE